MDKLENVSAAVDAIIDKVGKEIVVGMPLGLGKPNQLINALYQRACEDDSIHLKILTALSLEKPVASSKLEAAFLDPFLERVFGDCPDLDYILAVRNGTLPKNVEVCEFFFKPGSFLGNKSAQQNYISSNYTHAARDVFAQGCNVAAQIVASREQDGRTMISLSANPDTGPELIEMMREAEAAGERKSCVVALVNNQLPYMYNDAEVEADEFDLIIDDPDCHTTLFGTPKGAVTTPDYMIGLYASSLIPDGGTLQIGIGALGDAIVHATQFRHEDNSGYQSVLKNIGALERWGELIEKFGGTGIFEKGLYGATEMFVDGFLHLFKAGILKRQVFDFTELQILINDGRLDPENIQADVLDELDKEGVRVLRTNDFEQLQHLGLFTQDCGYDLGHIVAPDGERIMANLAIPETRQKLAEKCLGEKLRNGVVLHGGFFLGPNDFYQGLHDLSEEENRLICMTGVDKINQLDCDPNLYKAQRKNARFINTGIMATTTGAVVSDGLEDGRVVSGVGGQYNFVAMAHHLLTGRSILMVRSVREKGGQASSNIVTSYGHVTIPRHLRDIVITEYGIADLRSQTDSEVAKRMLNVTDSRFQQEILTRLKAAGKVEANYEIPEAFSNNTPAALEAALAPAKQDGRFGAFPFGTDFTEQELTLTKALGKLKARAAEGKFKAWWAARQVKEIPAAAQPYLERMQLTNPENAQEQVVQKLLILELGALGVF